MSTPYLQSVPVGPLQIALVGKDPFPTAHTEIPFCKATWTEQIASNCSGRYVLESLGIALSEAQAEYETPKGLFEELRNVGIVFLNASHTYVGGRIVRSKHLPLLITAHLTNKPLLQAAKRVVYCGEAWKVSWIDPTVQGERCVHPDVRNKYNPRTVESWEQSWGENALFNRLGLTLPI